MSEAPHRPVDRVNLKRASTARIRFPLFMFVSAARDAVTSSETLSMTSTNSVSQHYGSTGLSERILHALKQAGKDLNCLTVDDLASLDQFHTRGLAATRELIDFAGDAWAGGFWMSGAVLVVRRESLRRRCNAT